MNAVGREGALDLDRITFLTDDKYSEEIFFVEQNRKVSKTNVFSINSQKYECPVDLRGKTVQVRFSRHHRNRFIVFYADKRMGEASLLNPLQNADQIREQYENNTKAIGKVLHD